MTSLRRHYVTHRLCIVCEVTSSNTGSSYTVGQKEFS